MQSLSCLGDMASNAYHQLPEVVQNTISKAAVPIGATLALTGPQGLPIAAVYLVTTSASETAGSRLLPDSMVGKFMKGGLSIGTACATGQYIVGGGLAYQAASHTASYVASAGVNQLVEKGIEKFNVTGDWTKTTIKTAASLATSYFTTKAVQMVVEPNFNTGQKLIAQEQKPKPETTRVEQPLPQNQPEQTVAGADTAQPTTQSEAGFQFVCSRELHPQQWKCSVGFGPNASESVKQYIGCLDEYDGRTIEVQLLESQSETIHEQILAELANKTPECSLHYGTEKQAGQAGKVANELALQCTEQVSNECDSVYDCHKVEIACHYDLDGIVPLNEHNAKLRRCLKGNGNPDVVVSAHDSPDSWFKDLEYVNSNCFDGGSNADK